VFALFGSKEELQLATVEAARQIFVDRVVAPALRTAQGAGRVQALCEAWLEYSSTRVFSGGCFFASANAEFGARPGRIREELAAAQTQWFALVSSVVERAWSTDAGERAADAEQVAFELISIMETANAWSVLHDDPAAYERAHRAVIRILAAEFGA